MSRKTRKTLKRTRAAPASRSSSWQRIIGDEKLIDELEKIVLPSKFNGTLLNEFIVTAVRASIDSDSGPSDSDSESVS